MTTTTVDYASVVTAAIVKLCSKSNKKPAPTGAGLVAVNGQVVDTVDLLLELVADIDPKNWFDEVTYTGTDFQNVDVLRARLPENYFARVEYIRAEHIPEPYYRKGEVYPYLNRNGELQMVCPRIQLVLTNKGLVSFFKEMRFETPAEVINENYHFVTFKICREDGSLKSWATGIDKDTGLCKTLNQHYVKVGH
jgi:hypothetical protein